ncbi:ATP-binding protein [bacterium SCSIO 12643]|nr:ATP-binding protein [bacterium SCSIO 12643]
MYKILITGPESSGKSFLAKALAEYYDGGIVEEYARIYLSNKSDYYKDDLLNIAKGQFKLEKEVYQGQLGYVFSDTGVEVIKIWSQEKYNEVDPEIRSLEKRQIYDLILLCKPNIPWVYDELRENKTDRDRLFELYKNDLKDKKNVLEINETLEKRLDQAIQFINERLS